MAARLTSVRVGHGWDIHRLVAGRPLVLGGVAVPFELGLLGHSDGDVVLHAVTDAILGALAAGDIGQHFPDTDVRYRGADSALLLGEIVALLAGRGGQVGNVDVTVIAERPKLAPFMAAIRTRVAALLGVEEARVGLKAKTAEGIGAVGAGDAIAAMAVVLVEPAPRRRPAPRRPIVRPRRAARPTHR